MNVDPTRSTASNNVDALQAAVDALKLLNNQQTSQEDHHNSNSDSETIPPPSLLLPPLLDSSLQENEKTVTSTSPEILPAITTVSPLTQRNSCFVSAPGPRKSRNFEGFTLSPQRAAVHTITVNHAPLQQESQPSIDQSQQLQSCTTPPRSFLFLFSLIVVASMIEATGWAFRDNFNRTGISGYSSVISSAIVPEVF